MTIVSDNGTLLIYNMSSLIWAAQLADVPISIARSNLNSLPGAICTLSENGKIGISYLGSDPQIFQVPSLNLQKLNFEKTQHELIELEKEIKAGIDFTDISTINASAERDLNVDFSIQTNLENCKYTVAKTSMSSLANDDAKMILANVTLRAQIHLEQIQVQYYCTSPLTTNNAIHSIQQLAVDQVEHSEAWFYMENDFDIVSTTITIIVSYINKQSIPRVIEKQKSLPLSMFYKLFLPQKESTIKLTISVDEITAPSIQQLFSNEFDVELTQNAIAFKSIYSGHVVTIVMAKNSNRYR